MRLVVSIPDASSSGSGARGGATTGAGVCSGAVLIGAEGETNPRGEGIRIVGNRLRNDNPLADSFVRNFGTRDDVVLSGNRFFGPGSPLAGPGRVLP